MPLAPEIASFGDDSHDAGDTGLTVTGGGFGAFPGELWIYENSNRTGNADQLTVGTWNDIELSGVEIPSSLNNTEGTRYLFLQREDLAWSQGHEFALSIPEDDVVADQQLKKGKSRTRPPVYVVTIQGVDYLVSSYAHAKELAEANTPSESTEQVLADIPTAPTPPDPPPEPSVASITMPDPRPSKVAMPRAQVGVRKLV